MARPWKPHDFDSSYERYICQDEMQFGGRDYHRRYRSRYKECMRRFAALAPPNPVDVLEVGGGQLAVLSAKLWNDSRRCGRPSRATSVVHGDSKA